MKETKGLSEECVFDFKYISKIFEGIVNTSLERVSENLKNLIEVSKISDNDRREEFLSELDIRLKSLAPRKGKIEVEDYDKRINEIEKHNEKYITHTKEILKRNDNDEAENKAIIDHIQQEFDDLQILFGKLAKGMGKYLFIHYMLYIYYNLLTNIFNIFRRRNNFKTTRRKIQEVQNKLL